MFSHIKLARYEIVLEAGDEGLQLPSYKGSTLRGGFGKAFQQVVCAQRDKDCHHCLLQNNCAYSYIFETAPPPGGQILRKYENIPRPFILEPPLEAKTNYQPGEKLAFQLVLIGKAINYLPYFIVIFRELGQTGIGKGRRKYRLDAVKAVNLRTGEKNVIYSREIETVINVDVTISGNEPAGISSISYLEDGPVDLKMRFITMTRLKFAQNYTTVPEFHIIIRNLLRRLSSISYFHHDTELELDFRGLIQRAGEVNLVDRQTRWEDWERYSSRQDARMNLGGIVGEAVYRGKWQEFWPMLKLADDQGSVYTGSGCQETKVYRLRVQEILWGCDIKVYFLTDEERKQVVKGFLPKSRELGVAEELRGWNWHLPPLAPVYDQRLGVYEIAGKYCDSGRDVYLRKIDGIKVRPNKEMISGSVFHEALVGILVRAKRLIYTHGVADYQAILKGLREPIELDWTKCKNILSSGEVKDLKRKIEIICEFEAARIGSRIQEILIKQPYIGEDSLVALAIPVVVEQKLDGSFLGLSRNLSADAFTFSEPMVLDLKFGARKDFHRLSTTGYALVMEAIYEFPINLGCIVYVEFKDDRLVMTKDIHIIDDELRQWFIEERDEKMRMIYEEIDPGMANKCPENCPHLTVCCG